MKKIFFALSLCIALSATSAQAQSLDALINSLSSFFGSSEEPAKAAPKITHPEAYDLMGRWYFDTLVMDYTGDSSLATVAVSTWRVARIPSLRFRVVISPVMMQLPVTAAVST